MKVLIALLILLFGLAVLVAAAPIQEKIQLNLADTIDALADYSLIYDPSPSFCVQYAGLTTFSLREIRICDRMDQAQKKAIVIHELLHVVSLRRSVIAGEQWTDDEVEQGVMRIYKELYGRGYK